MLAHVSIGSKVSLTNRQPLARPSVDCHSILKSGSHTFNIVFSSKQTPTTFFWNVEEIIPLEKVLVKVESAE